LSQRCRLRTRPGITAWCPRRCCVDQTTVRRARDRAPYPTQVALAVPASQPELTGFSQCPVHHRTYTARVDKLVRRRLPHTIPQWVPATAWFFITIKCVPVGKNQLCRADTGEAVLAAMRYNHESLVWHCRLGLLMPDHLHAILAFPLEPGMVTVVTNWKRFVARRADVSWQRDFFDHRLRDHHELAETLSYVLMNPVRKGLCGRSEDWIWTYRPDDRPPPTLG